MMIKPRTRIGIAVASIALVIGLAGCSGADSGESAKDVANRPTVGDCMRDKGFEFTDATGEMTKATIPDGVDKNEYLDALGSCAKDAGIEQDGAKPAAQDPSTMKKLRAISECVRERGVADYPDPDSEGNVPRDYAPSDPDAVRAAEEACMESSGISGGATGSGR